MAAFTAICNRLSPRERLVLSHVVAGENMKETGRAMGISPRTVEAHRIAIRRKLGARNVADVIRIALTGVSK